MSTEGVRVTSRTLKAAWEQVKRRSVRREQVDFDLTTGLDEESCQSQLSSSMHELTLADSLIMAIRDQLGEARVRSVTIEVGKLSGVVPEALTFAFEICTKDTLLTDTVLIVDDVPATARCEECGVVAQIDSFVAARRCGSVDLKLLTGQELRIKSVEVS